MRKIMMLVLFLTMFAAGCGHTEPELKMEARPRVVSTNQSPLTGTWDVIKGNELPKRSLQLQFEPDIYISQLQFLPNGQLRVTRKKNVGGRVSFGTWRLIPDAPNEGMLFLVYPRWPDSTGRSSKTNNLDTSVLLRGDSIILENIGSRRMELKKGTEKAQQKN